MPVAVFVSNESDAACLIPWGVRFAQADHTDLIIVCPKKSKGKTSLHPLESSKQDQNPLYRAVFDILDSQDPGQVVSKQAISEGQESTDMDRVVIDIRELEAPSPGSVFVDEISSLDLRLLLLPAHVPASGTSKQDMTWHQKLFTNAPCEVALVKGTPPESDGPIRVLVASEGDADSDAIVALERGCQLARHSKGSVTLLYVRPNDDMVAEQIARSHLKRLIRNVSQVKIEIEQRVELADSLCVGIEKLSLEAFDLILVGARKTKTIRAIYRDMGRSDQDFPGALAAIRESVPLTDRVWIRFKTWVRSGVPQMDREHRVSLVDRLQNNSEFNFDFVALISLSTLIAALGLARNSGAVVIGAMLVAPLMTPLVAIGFALVQGNLKLIRGALNSVLLGFTVALSIGAALGLVFHVIAPGFEVSSEMSARGTTNLLDLVVALASGVAGAYAMGRPNLVSALPGVAIAAALVPPIATSGLALTMGNLELAAGASLLFFTNIVAIVLGTAITFWSVGISTRVTKGRPQTWPRYWFLGFVIISFSLAAYMSVQMYDPDDNQDAPKTQTNVQAMLDL